jgi:RNA ligase (TIGR02306 family)
MHDLAVVSTIEAIRPIVGKDRIVMATVENYNSIVPKDAYKVGDEVVYVFYDSILPEGNPDFEFLRPRCYSAKLEGFRIRPMKIGEEISEGLVLPISVLPTGKNYKKGDIVSDDLKIRAYEPAEVATPSEVIGTYPTAIPKSDEENIEKVFENYPQWKEIEFYVTEKIDGTAATWFYNAKDDAFRIFSHGWEVGESGVWFDAARNENLKEKMASYCEAHGLDNLVMQGEVVGPFVQKNLYKVSKASFYIYGMMTSEGRRYPFEVMKAACEEMGIRMVPLIREHAHMPDTLDALLKDCDGRSTQSDVPREGLVWRSMTPGRDVHFKVKSRPYKIWFDKK